MTKRILVVAAHPDDEVLGMGGTIARHSESGDTVHVLFLGDGISSRTGTDDALVAARQHAADRACKILGASIVGFETFPDNGFDSVPLLSIAKAVEAAKRAVNPEVIYTHHGGDLNIDHRMTCQAVLTAFRPQPHEAFAEIRAFETNSATEWASPSITPPFLPDTYVDISLHLEQLLSAYVCYTAEMREEPHARSVEALRIAALHRGRQVGLHAAEAFVTLRRIIRKEIP